MFTSRFAPQVLGILLMMAGAAYSFDALAHALQTQKAGPPLDDSSAKLARIR